MTEHVKVTFWSNVIGGKLILFRDVPFQDSKVTLVSSTAYFTFSVNNSSGWSLKVYRRGASEAL